MKDHVDIRLQQSDVVANSLPHTTLDAIALDGIAKYFAGGESHARARRRRGFGGAGNANRGEVRHRWRELLTAGFVDPLVVSVLAQPRTPLAVRGKCRRAEQAW